MFVVFSIHDTTSCQIYAQVQSTGFSTKMILLSSNRHFSCLTVLSPFPFFIFFSPPPHCTDQDLQHNANSQHFMIGFTHHFTAPISSMIFIPFSVLFKFRVLLVSEVEFSCSSVVYNTIREDSLHHVFLMPITLLLCTPMFLPPFFYYLGYPSVFT